MWFHSQCLRWVFRFASNSSTSCNGSHWITRSPVLDHIISCIGSHDLLYWITRSPVLNHMISCIGSHDLLVLDHMISCIGSHDLLYWVTWSPVLDHMTCLCLKKVEAMRGGSETLTFILSTYFCIVFHISPIPSPVMEDTITTCSRCASSLGRMLLVTDNAYSYWLPYVTQLAVVFLVKVSGPYFFNKAVGYTWNIWFGYETISALTLQTVERVLKVSRGCSLRQ